MAFEHLPPSKPTPRREKNQQIFCVGWRAFVHWPQPTGRPLDPVPLLDSTGKTLDNDLADGQEVEIMSWRPRSRDGLLYQIRRVTDGSEWWIGAIHLRRQRQQAGAPAALAKPLPLGNA